MQRRLKYTALTLAAMGFNTGVIAQAHDTSSGDEVSKTYELTGFDQIAVGGVYEVSVEVGPAYSIALKGPAKEMDRVNVYAEDGTLCICRRWHALFKPQEKEPQNWRKS